MQKVYQFRSDVLDKALKEIVEDGCKVIQTTGIKGDNVDTTFVVVEYPESQKEVVSLQELSKDFNELEDSLNKIIGEFMGKYKIFKRIEFEDTSGDMVLSGEPKKYIKLEMII